MMSHIKELEKCRKRIHLRMDSDSSGIKGMIPLRIESKFPTGKETMIPSGM